jgi:hypothetical protein
MTDLEIIVPVSLEEQYDAALARCLDGIAKNTPVVSFRVLLLVVAHANPGRRPPPLENLPPDFPWTMTTYHTDELGTISITGSVLRAIEDAAAQYIAVLPPSHAINDPGWFGKMQTPFLRTPNCGLAMSADDPNLAGKGMEPFPWKARAGAPGDLVFAPRETLIAIAGAAKLLHYSEALYLAANALGLVTWAVPGVRIDIANAKGPDPRKQSPNAYRPG